MEDDSSEEGTSLGVRRLCVATAGGEPRLLSSAVHSAAFDRLYVAATSDGEIAVAPPGIDEIHLIRDLVAVVSQRSLGTGERFPFILLALDLGIVRIVGDGFGGAGLCRVRSLASNRGVAKAASELTPRHRQGESQLMVVVPPSLHIELLADGLAGAWHYVPDADAWLWPADRASEALWHDELKHHGHTG
ncbi:hypothetical protein ABIA35_008259 [Catenulispora sp. MAP12-49]|uniref:hypothetical protein n=1 Tax=unclassified Catenulispora TaxID=414885 RepID=UPI003514506B